VRFGKGAPYVFKLFPAMLQVHAEMQQAGLPENEMCAAVLCHITVVVLVSLPLTSPSWSLLQLGPEAVV